MIAAFKALSGMQKVLWSLGVLLTPLFIIGAVAPTPGMQKTAEVYQSTELPAPPAPEAPVAAIVSEPQVLRTETKTITETMALPYASLTQEDPTLEIDKAAVAVRGVDGEKLITYTVTYAEGQETNRVQVDEKITKESITEVKKIGTKPKALPAIAPRQTTPQCEREYRRYTKICPQLSIENTCNSNSHNHSTLVFGAARLLDFTLRPDKNTDSEGCE